MKRISAHWIYPVSSPPLKYGILEIEDDGTIIRVIDTGGIIRETEKLLFYSGILVPGFVNAHCHLELSHLAGVLPQGKGMPEFVKGMMNQEPISDETVLAAMRKADQVMCNNGIVAVGDISNKEISLPVKKESRLHYTNFIEIFSSDPDQADRVFNRGHNLVKSYEEVFAGSVHLTPHAPYSVSEKLWELIKMNLLNNPGIISYHNLESFAEMEFFRGNKGALSEHIYSDGIKTDGKTNSFILASEHLAMASRVLLVHNTYATHEDIRFAREFFPDYYWVLCPSSNLFIENRLPDLSAFRGENHRICLGTDSLASNDSLSIVKEMQILIQNFSDLKLETIIQWGTLNGAKALGIDSTFGSFDPGKKPGVIRITGFDDADRTEIHLMT